MEIQIGKYKRPGIFTEEFDNSVMATPIVEGITNMVIGVSKKGPINTPIRLTTDNDIESIFGSLDRGLERKGSFFHRTIKKMLESAPVYAINLLKTDDILDTIEYKSLSSSAGYKNDILREGAYRRFFNTTGFWKRDTESFISLTTPNTGNSERAFSITNLSDKYVTAFIVKSNRTGFDRTLIEWYGSQEKLPPYVNANDYASDYLVDVVIVGGNWTNYQTLAVDTRWSSYFNASGLIKSQLRNFANDRNITLLGYYEGLSLIPYFRDENGSNIFIETIINRDTDKTGVFCAFNSDLVEVDYYNGLLDIVGQTIAGVNEASVEFLSYKETITESIQIKAVPLDLPGNVTALLGATGSGFINQDDHAFSADGAATVTDIENGTGYIQNEGNRTAWFAEGYINGLTQSTLTVASMSISQIYGAESNSYVVIGGELVSVTGGTLTLNSSDYLDNGITMSYASTFILDATGTISTISNMTGVIYPGTASTPAVDSSYIVLGYIRFNVINGEFDETSCIVTPVNINGSGFVDYSRATDYSINDEGSGVIRIDFLGTNTTPSTANYEQYRRFKMFNRLVDLIDSVNKDKMSLCLGANGLDYRKVSLSTMTLSDIITTTTSNKSFKLHTGLTSLELSNIIAGDFVLYTEDNEFILGTNTVTTMTTVATASNGVISKYSKMYTDFYNGIINTGDYFYANKLSEEIVKHGETVDVSFVKGENVSLTFSGHNYIVIKTISQQDPGFNINDQILIPGSILNPGSFTIANNSNPHTLAVALEYTENYSWAYEVYEEVVEEDLFNIGIIYDYLKKHYLKMYLDGAGIVTVTFMDEDLVSAEPIESLIANTKFNIQSSKSNFKQTVEIETADGYVEVPNKILINGTRYTEVKVGDYLAAYYDPTQLVNGEVPRKLTRILSKKAYAGNTSLVELSCDAEILKVKYGIDDYQTTRYTGIDAYATTYKGITLEGFRIRTDSMPNGTETRQNEILNLVAKGTPLFKALTNKESIDFRYLIDSFGLGLIERSKQQLVDICGERLDTLGFINMPSMKSFKNSSSPSFIDSEGILQMEYVAKGGDPESSPAFLYSFADGDGVSCAGYFLPYLNIDDNGRAIDVPPAAWVATTYMRKHISNISGITPWTIAAGVTNGRVTGINHTEMVFSNEDIEWINGAQMNPIVFKRNRGNVIETENTSQTLYKSALSYLHVREVLIELERELSRMLIDYKWKYNTPSIRAEIKLRADVICETYVSKNGLYNYFNKMDEENNTVDIIDNQIGVIDTYVEVIKGMGIIVNNITILKTGSIASGGFLTT